ncbi:MAG: peptidase M16 [Gammaproteobacteria bacterium]|nr:MAG: peptidase M16 [Gammaproteobacteria bacterium]
MHPCFRLLIVLLCLSVTACVAPSSSPDPTADLLRPHTPAIDTREHRYLELPNGLRVLVISDPDTDQAAAALSVGVGSLADPPNREGLAHFLEHMLFLGTEKYPSPDEYSDFISRHGGRYNAYTAQDHTNYFFEIAHGQLDGALDRFAQFFVAPLFDANYVSREMNAVHSEYMLQMREDGWRSFMTQKRAMNPEHPAARFNIGSLETLADRPDDPIRETLLEFYDRHYSADRMGLVILGREDVTTLAGWASDMFSDVPQREVAESEPDLPLFRDDDLPVLLQIQPIRELRSLQISFPLPPLDPHYRVAPGDYLANLIGHEGEGSLHAWLTEQGWIDSLGAGAGHYGRNNATFSVSVRLTESGLEHWQDVAAATFAYIDLVSEHGIDGDRYSEQQQLNRLAFDFREKGAAFGYVRRLAENLLLYPPEDVVRANFAMDDFDRELIGSFLAELRPQNAFVTLTAPEVDTDREEPYFGVRYSLAPLSGDTLARLRDPGPHPALALPAENPFVPERLDLLATTDDAPQRVTAADPMQIWHMTDPSFGAPRATLRIDLRSPAAEGPEAWVLGNLYARLVDDALNTRAYPARLAGLSYSLRGDRTGMSLTLGGFDDKLEVLLDMVLDTMVTLEPRQERFEHYRRELQRELRNELQQRPYERAMGELRRLLQIPEYDLPTLLAVAEAATLEDLGSWRGRTLDGPGVLALMHGNLDAERSGRLADRIKTKLGGTDPEVGPEPRLVRLTNEPVQRRVEVEHDDAAIAHYVQGENQSWEERARFGLLGHILSTPYFNQLRTEQQLGYVVFAGSWVRVNTPGLIFVVQSPVAAPATVAAATTAFLGDFRERLAVMTPEQFESEREGLLARLLERDQNLNGRGSRLWRDLQDQVLDFDSRERLATAIRAVELEAFSEFYERFMELAETRAATLWATGRFPLEESVPPGTPVEDVDAFKAARDSFGTKREN